MPHLLTLGLFGDSFSSKPLLPDTVFSSRHRPRLTLAFTLMERVLDVFLQISDCRLIESRPPCVDH